MSTDKTMADVQPSGRVRLGDSRALIQRYDAAGAKFRESLMDDRYSDAQRVELRRELTAAQDELLTALAARQPVEFERAIPTRRRESAVELLLKLGFVWNNQRWEDRRQPVGGAVAVVVPGAPTRCRHCESTDLEWFAHVRAVNDVPHGRLTTHDVGCVFVLGCNECSETLHTVKADSIAALLAVPPAQAVDLVQEHVATLTVDDDGMLGWSLTHIGRDLPEGKYRLALIDGKAVGK